MGLIFYRLRSVLGTRDDDEPQPPHERSGRFGFDASAFGEPDQRADTPPNLRVVSNEPIMEEELGDTIRGLARYKEVDRAFNEQDFIAGAQRAYEMILLAFAAGDLDTLKLLLSEDVYAAFSGAISERAAQDEKMTTEITRMAKPVIDDVLVEGGLAKITVRFVAHIRSYFGDEDSNPERTEDLWTFERQVDSVNPNWRLAATQTV